MEPTPRYPLAPTALGDGVVVGVDKLVHAVIHEHAARLPLRTTVELEPHAVSGAWRVRWPQAHGAVVGTISADARTAYSPVERVHDAAMIPSAVATVDIDRATGACTMGVQLAPPELAIPRNNPLDGAMVLPSAAGETAMVNVSRGEFSANETLLMSPGQWVVGLRVMGDDVVVTCDGRALGTLNHDDAVSLRDRLDAFAATGAPVMARAYAVEGRIGVDCSVARGSGAVAHLPALPLPPAEPVEPFHVYVYADGTIAVTVELAAAIDPEDQPQPRADARTVTLPWTQQQPDPMRGDAPTQYFPAPVGFMPSNEGDLAGEETYLSEVEKVRLRRAQRAQRTGDGPRHRRADNGDTPENYEGRHRRQD